jgi:hypothetical protein
MENTTNIVRLRQPDVIDDPLTELLVERRPGMDHVRPHFQVHTHASRAGAGGAQQSRWRGLFGPPRSKAPVLTPGAGTITPAFLPSSAGPWK